MIDKLSVAGYAFAVHSDITFSRWEIAAEVYELVY